MKTRDPNPGPGQPRRLVSPTSGRRGLLVDEAHAEVTELLTEHRDQLEWLTRGLLTAGALDAVNAYAAVGVDDDPVMVSARDDRLVNPAS